jgi:septal ring factor EnvC (AmiA/AmiB activator)
MFSRSYLIPYKCRYILGYLVVALLCYGLLIAELNAQEISKKDSEYQNSISKIGEKIKTISQNLNNDKALLKSERHQLFKAEKELASITKKLAKTEFELAKNQHELSAVELQIKSVNRSQKKNREALATLLVQRYQQGRPDYLKNVLNQENPYAVGRLANYHEFFAKALKQRNQELRKFAAQASQLKVRQDQIIDFLKRDKANQQTQLSKQNDAKSKRKKSISVLDKKVSSNTQVLAKLTKDRQRLSSLLAQLQQQAAELKRLEVERVRKAKALAKKQNKPSTNVEPPTRVIVKGGFKKQKGRLKYPVEGKLERLYGKRLPESGMRAEGHFFATNGSVPVKSIFRGRVLFSDFLKGYGLLIIVDHGDDHISLYGHNEQLLKNVGDSVEVNEVIGRTGVTGGLKSHGLYFEIRNNANPIDPASWCQKR